MAKAFGLSKTRAAARESAERALAPLAEQLQSPLEQATGDYMPVPLDELYPDPLNPRWAGDAPPTWEEVQHPETATDPERRAELEKIYELSRSMEPPIGQQTPIDVFRGAHGYHIIMGERRYWALRLRGSREAQVLLRPEPPQRIRLAQLIENVQRRSLSVRTQLFNLNQVIEEERSKGTPIESAVDLAKRVGYSERMGFRWWRILAGPQDVREAIQQRDITNLVLAAKISGVGNAKRRAQLIKNPALPRRGTEDDDDSESIESLLLQSQSSTAKPRKRGRGKPRQAVVFGRTTRLPVAKTILLKLDPEGDYSQTDWASFDDVTKAWQTLLQRYEADHN